MNLKEIALDIRDVIDKKRKEFALEFFRAGIEIDDVVKGSGVPSNTLGWYQSHEPDGGGLPLSFAYLSPLDGHGRDALKCSWPRPRWHSSKSASVGGGQQDINRGWNGRTIAAPLAGHRFKSF